MAATTISAIIEHIEHVLIANPLSLTINPDPFSDVGVANALVDQTAQVAAGGMVSSRSTSNYQAVRIDRVVVSVQRSMNFNGPAAQKDLQDLLDEIERAVIADGPNHSYFVNVEKGSRKVQRKKGTDVLDASLAFLVDYDFSEA
jgi:hypothetical protein